MLRNIHLKRFCSQFKNPKTNSAQSKMKSWKECYETYIWRDFAANSRTLKQILHNLKWKAERNVKKHTFEEILQRFVFEIGGFWVKIKFGLREVWVRQRRECKSVLKISHISLIKLKTRFFRGLDSREITREKHHWSSESFTGSF